MSGPGVIVAGADTHAQVRDTVPVSAAPRRFVRVKVSH